MNQHSQWKNESKAEEKKSMEKEKRSVASDGGILGAVIRPVRILCRNAAILLAAIYEVCLVEPKRRYEQNERTEGERK